MLLFFLKVWVYSGVGAIIAVFNDEAILLCLSLIGALCAILKLVETTKGIRF